MKGKTSRMSLNKCILFVACQWRGIRWPSEAKSRWLITVSAIMAVKPVGRKTDHNGLLLKPSSKVSPFYRKLLMSNSLRLSSLLKSFPSLFFFLCQALRDGRTNNLCLSVPLPLTVLQNWRKFQFSIRYKLLSRITKLFWKQFRKRKNNGQGFCENSASYSKSRKTTDTCGILKKLKCFISIIKTTKLPVNMSVSKHTAVSCWILKRSPATTHYNG